VLGPVRLHGVELCGSLPGLGGPWPAHPSADRVLRLVVEEPSPVPAGPPEGPIVLDTVVGGQQVHWAACRPDGWLLRVPGIADLAVDAGLEQATVRRAPGIGDDQLVLLVRGLLLAFVLALAGECVLHASAVAVDAACGAVAFAGPSGTGKSTLAALCCAEGARFITDDLLRVAGRPARWVGTAAELRLRPGATPLRLRRAATAAWATRRTPDGRTGVLLRPVHAAGGPLRAIVLPEPSCGDQVQVTPLPASEAAVRLALAHRIVQWRDPTLLSRQLAHAARLAETVPVLAVAVPWDEPPRAGLGAEVLATVAEHYG